MPPSSPSDKVKTYMSVAFRKNGVHQVRQSQSICDLYTTSASEFPQARRLFKCIKVISLGSKKCGKSCLIKRYCENKFIPEYFATTGVDYGVKSATVRNERVRVSFWDLSGDPEHFEVRNEFYRDSEGVILVFDVGGQKSFNELSNWVSEAKRFGVRDDIPLIVCGSKIDKPGRKVSASEGQAWAQSHGFTYFDTSASTGENVDAMFNFLFSSAIVSNTQKC